MASERQEFSRAVRLLSAAVQMRSLVGAGASPAERNLLACDRVIDGARRRLGDDRFDAAWHAGQTLTFAQAAAYALDARGEVEDAAMARLSRRELEVARLIALGCSNREIATRICVSVRTAEAHVTNCLAKLSLQRRSQLAVWATRQDGAELVVSAIPGMGVVQ